MNLKSNLGGNNMVIIEGTVDYVGRIRNVADKSVLDITILQRIEGFSTSITKLSFWSDNKESFDTAKSLQVGQDVQIYTNVACEKKNGQLTGQIKYFPVKISI